MLDELDGSEFSPFSRANPADVRSVSDLLTRPYDRQEAQCSESSVILVDPMSSIINPTKQDLLFLKLRQVTTPDSPLVYFLADCEKPGNHEG